MSFPAWLFGDGQHRVGRAGPRGAGGGRTGAWRLFFREHWSFHQMWISWEYAGVK